MNAIEAKEAVRKIRKNSCPYGFAFDYTESEAVALLTDEPSKTAEELVQQIWDECVTSPGAYVEFDNYGAAKLIQSALTAHAKAKVEETEDRFCAMCPIYNPCRWRVAILGREVGK